MPLASIFNLKTAIRIMVLGGLVACIVVAIQACQPTTNTKYDSDLPPALEQFRKRSLKKLTVLKAPPVRPDMEFTTAKGERMALSDLKGKVVLLNVWASWCAPCVAEMPTLNDLARQRGGEDFAIIAVSLDRLPTDPVDFFESQNINHLEPWYDESMSLASKLSAPGMPVSIFYDKGGQEVARVIGEANWTSPEALGLVAYLMAQ